MEEAMCLNCIVKTFPGVMALNNMSFQLCTGEIHAICGENGAGKSTLMKVVTGVHRPDSGEIIVAGKEQFFSNPNDAFAQGISIIYQETSLFEEMTVLENLFLNRELCKKVLGIPVLDYKTMTREVQNIFRRLQVDISPEAKIKDLGMAQKQMVEIAKALTFKAKILILDEPTASLSQREVDALFRIIRQLRDEGVGVVYISHRMEEIFALCDRVTVIRDGAYISTHKVAETNKDQLVAAMVGRSLDNYYPKVEVNIGETLFEATGLGDNALLHDISFKIKRGEIVGLAGLAGSGRTELALALCGLAPLTQGKMQLEDTSIHPRNYREALNHGIVYVSEDRGKYGLVLEMSIKDNISLPQLSSFAHGGFLSVKEERKVADSFRQSMGIKAPDSDFPVKNLSGGNQQKVSVSKALALSPRLLILDEPTRGVDVNAKAEIHKIISGMAAQGLTILMISSELPELLGMCDRIYVMQNGTIAGCFDAQNATQEEILHIALAPSITKKE